MVGLIAEILFILAAVPAYADIGPKGSVQVTFTETGGKIFFATLLSRESSLGPVHVWDGNIQNMETQGEEVIWRAFVKYQDEENFYFLQRWWDCSKSCQLNWIYIPPSAFKILIYFPQENTFAVSPIYERYAFDSYFTANLSEIKNGYLKVEKNYQYDWEIFSLIVRILGTIAVEMGIAFLFGYREKKLFTFLAVVNMVTQVVLNIGLNIVNYYQGKLAFIIYYSVWEIIVFMIESVLYLKIFPYFSSCEQKKGKIIVYALIANILSFSAGMQLSRVLPGIF